VPRVSDEHRERRRRQILDAARRCFVRQGFHQTSMADILTEAHLSAGAVYRYFTGKSQLIAAIAEDVIGQVTDLLEPIVTQEPPPTLDEVVRQGLTATGDLAFGEDGFARLAPQVWAEALRDPALAQVLRTRYHVLHGLISRLVVAEQKSGRVAADSDPDDVAKVLIGAIMGYILQRLLIGNVDPNSYAAGLAALTPIMPR
jgi:AcrR family transcriptional regulator